MQLWVMRHGEAGWHREDRERSLTEAGRDMVQRTGHHIAESPLYPACIWTSPYLRARQTAAILAGILDCPVEVKPFITPDDDPAACMDALLAYPEPSLMLVSHMPFVGVLSTLLVEGHRQGMPFLTAQALFLDMPVAAPGCAELKGQYLP